jgi:hypothetical protein
MLVISPGSSLESESMTAWYTNSPRTKVSTNIHVSNFFMLSSSFENVFFYATT